MTRTANTRRQAALAFTAAVATCAVLASTPLRAAEPPAKAVEQMLAAAQARIALGTSGWRNFL